MVLNSFLKMPPSPTCYMERVERGEGRGGGEGGADVYDIVNLTTGIFCNRPFKAFLEGLSKDKDNLLFARKTYSFDAAASHLFLCSIYYLQM